MAERADRAVVQHAQATLDRISIVDGDDLRVKLVEFRAWNNHAQPHQHLGGHTPAEAWSGRPKPIKRPGSVSIWDGHISGGSFRPDFAGRGNHQRECHGHGCPRAGCATGWKGVKSGHYLINP